MTMPSQPEGATHIEVLLAAGVTISTFNDIGTGWVTLGPAIPVSYAAGDQFGVRTYGTNINVYKNGALVGTRSFVGWQFANSGGFIGLAMVFANSASRLDSFGGGNYLPVVNTAP